MNILSHKIMLLTLILLSSILSCKPGAIQEKKIPEIKNNIEKGLVLKKINCENDTSLSYSLYLPSSYNSANKYPVIIFFDAHSNGKLPLKLYKSIAEKYNIILVGSNNSKNGLEWAEYNKIGNTLISEISNKYSIDNDKLWLSGFSGGARVVGGLAKHDKRIKAIICCSAGISFDKEDNNVVYVGIVGNEDFNFNEMRAIDRYLNETNIYHKLIVFNGIHKWSEEIFFEKAIQFIIKPEKDTVIKNNNTNLKNKLEEEAKEKQLIQIYASVINTKDLKWWKSEVNKLNIEIKNNLNNEKSLMLKRVKNYLSLVVYMYTDNAFKSENFKDIERLLELYKLIDPENPEHYYLNADIYMIKGNSPKAIESLNNAVKLGFKDYDRFVCDKYFNNLKNLKQYSDIKQTLKNSE